MGQRQLLAIACLGVTTLVSAQVGDKLPPTPDYLGEIRRTPDGRLQALPETVAAAATARSLAPATMIATMTPNPYQVSRFRQKSPANAVKNVKVAKAVRPGLPGTRAARLRQGARAVAAGSAGIRVELTGLFSLTRASPRFFVSEYGVCVSQGERHTKAAWPVIDLPTMRVFISLVPSYE